MLWLMLHSSYYILYIHIRPSNGTPKFRGSGFVGMHVKPITAQEKFNFPRANAILARAQALLWVRDWCTTDSHFTSSGKHLPMRTTQKLVKLVLPVENLMYSSLNLDGGYMKRSFVCSQWFLLSSETTASRVCVLCSVTRYFARQLLN